MLKLERLRPDHAAAVLTLEKENRSFFASTVPDRGDDYFTDFGARHATLLAEQDEGVCHFHGLVDAEGTVVGRFNLVDVADAEAELGFRIAESATGRGIATSTVDDVCALAAPRYGLSRLRAATTLDNMGSRAVLARTGFTVVGETELDGRPAVSFRRLL